MLFNSFSFLLFFPIVVLCYYLMPAKFRNFWLLLCSYYFYMNWNVRYSLLLALSTFITYLCGLFIESFHNHCFYKKLCLFLCFLSNLSILFFFKYVDFALELFAKTLGIFHLSFSAPSFDLLLPVGISFYTFQALSYTADIYQGKLKAEKNIIRYALYVSFFPQLVAGPIERSKTLLTQFQKTDHSPTAFSYKKAREGLFYMLLGYFEKTIIAYRASIYVDTVYNDYTSKQGFTILFATILFAIQIYCDFGGYSHIAIGAAKVLGIDIMDNFHQPYLANGIKDFWRRWHISLSTWFRDYLYIPLGGNRKGRIRKHLNLMITFLVSGLWHGASMHYVIWGGIHGIYQILEDLCAPIYRRLTKNFTHPLGKAFILALNRLLTFVLVCIAWVFFRAGSLTDSLAILSRSLHGLSLSFFINREYLYYGLNGVQFSILMASILGLFLFDYLIEHGIRPSCLLTRLPLIPRWVIYFLLITPVFLQAIYSFGAPASTFIYFQF